MHAKVPGFSLKAKLGVTEESSTSLAFQRLFAQVI